MQLLLLSRICSLSITISLLTIFFSFSVSASQAVLRVIPVIAKKCVDVLPSRKIIEFSKLPTTECGQILDKMPISQAAREDTYLRILIAQNKLVFEEAESLYTNLKNVPGFAATLRKISGSNPVQQKGHLYEVWTANELKKRGYNIIEIGKKFNDPAKNKPTDIDIIIEKRNTKFALELKSYSQETFRDYQYRYEFFFETLPKDMQTLKAFQKENTGAKITFVMEHKPEDRLVLANIERISKMQQVDVIYATAEELPLLLSQMIK